MAYPIFKDEIISPIDSDFEPQYTITYAGGTLENVKLQLNNKISQPGTGINAVTMNNLFDFDNLESMAGNYKETLFSGSIIDESIKAMDKNITVATRKTTFSAINIVVDTIIFSDDGSDTLRKTRKTTDLKTLKEMVVDL